MLSLGSLNLNLLVALDALLQTRSVRRAAERLGVTQSAMSHSLRQLRTLLCDPLFVRSGNQLLVTPRASEMTLPLRQALADLHRVLTGQSTYQPSITERRFVIASTDALALTLFAPLVADLLERSPPADLVFVPLDQARLESQLSAGEIDLAVGMLQGRPGIRIESLLTQRFAVLARRDHPQIGRKLDLEAYCRLPHAMVTTTGEGRSFVDEELERMGRSRRVVLRVPYFLAAPVLIARSELLLTIHRATALHFSERYPLTVHEPPFVTPESPVTLAWHERFQADPAVSWLRERVLMAAKRTEESLMSRATRRKVPTV